MFFTNSTVASSLSEIFTGGPWSLWSGSDRGLSWRRFRKTPHEIGYSDTDTRHNFSAATSTTLPWKFQLSGIVRWISGSPRSMTAGFDIDGDSQTQNDRPAGLGITVGRSNVDEQLKIINDLRATRNLAPISKDFLKLDPFFNVDVRVTKALTLGAQQRLEVFIEAFNATNRVTLTGGGGSIISPSLGIRTGSRAARQIQLGARYVF